MTTTTRARTTRPATARTRTRAKERLDAKREEPIADETEVGISGFEAEARKAKAKALLTEIVIPELRLGETRMRIIGTQPLYQNKMSEKAKRSLLAGGKKKTAAEKAEIKHDPESEYVAAVHYMLDGPTAVGLSLIAVKGALCTAALETAGITKTSAQRLIIITGEFVPLYGTPQLKMDVVRNADINRTPDIRTRPFFPMWGAEVTIYHVLPQLGSRSVYTLAANAGIVVGLGDYRQEKGKGSFGSFRVISADEQDDEWDELVAHHGRAQQEAAIADPEYADRDTANLMRFMLEERKKRAS